MFQFPKWIVIQLTEKCNLHCEMCYQHGLNGYYEHKKMVELDFHLIKKILSESLMYKPHIGLFGGEPLLYSYFSELLHFIKDNGFTADLTTNGTLLKKYAVELVDCAFDRIWVSIDGPETTNDQQRGLGTYQKVKSGLEVLFGEKIKKKSEYPQIGINYVVTNKNWNTISEFFIKDEIIKNCNYVSIELANFITQDDLIKNSEILKKNNLFNSLDHAAGFLTDLDKYSNMDFTVISRQIADVKEFCKLNGIKFISSPQNCSYENIKNYYSQNWHKLTDQRAKCPYPWILAEISSKGDLTTCHAMYDIIHGNICHSSLKEIWNSDSLKRFRNIIKKQLLPVCMACSMYHRQENFIQKESTK